LPGDTYCKGAKLHTASLGSGERGFGAGGDQLRSFSASAAALLAQETILRELGALWEVTMDDGLSE